MKNTCLFLSSALLAIATGCDHADNGHASHTHGANCSHSHAKSEENAPLASPITHHSPFIANLRILFVEPQGFDSALTAKTVLSRF